MQSLHDKKLGIIGLGYVGLPLAVEFAKKYPVVGFDVSRKRVDGLRAGCDHTMEVSEAELNKAKGLTYSYDTSDLADCNIYIVTVPTPIDSHNRPDLNPLESASGVIGEFLKSGDIVIYESTVYPGTTEEICIPILEQLSGLTFNKDFFVGYSPERINPGDKERRLVSIKKVTSGSNANTAEVVDNLYKSIIEAGTFKASSIKVAEACKVIENTQRDLNIALVNELAKLFSCLGIDTKEVLDAAATKWNFLPYKPGLVGGHCIGVDPYYLTHKAHAVGYYPELILAARRLNDGMAKFVVSELVKLMLNRSLQINNSRVLVMGFAFKENCPDIRNTKVVDVVRELHEYNIQVDVYDPWIGDQATYEEYGIHPVVQPEPGVYSGIILAVAHSQFVQMSSEDIETLRGGNCAVYDLKHAWPGACVDKRL